MTRLPDGDGSDLVKATVAQRLGTRIIVTSAEIPREESFSLQKLGAHAFLPKPHGVEALERALLEPRTKEEATDAIDRTVSSFVGTLSQSEMVEYLKLFSTIAALRRTETNITRAAELLGKPRTNLQQDLRALAVEGETPQDVAARLVRKR